MKQPDKNIPILPREWVHRFYEVQLLNKATKAETRIRCNSSNTFITDINPIWFVYSLMKTSARSLYILYLDTTNKCNDFCPMCFSRNMRETQGLNREIDVDLVMKRIRELRKKYSTFQVVSIAGPGEPLLFSRLGDILKQCNQLDIATRVFTNGELLNSEHNRELLLRYSSLVRISLDAASDSTYYMTHGRDNFFDRINSIKKLLAEREKFVSNTTVGTHYVIQKCNYKEISSFAKLCKDVGVDYIVYSQETLGKVNSEFTSSEIQEINSKLDEALKLHDHTFSVITPAHVLRKTFKDYNVKFFSNSAKLDLCHSGTSRIFFSVTNKFSACWLDNSNDQFIDHSYIGELQDEETMEQIMKMIQDGLGSVLTNGAYLGCDRCFSSNYNNMVNEILKFVCGCNAENIEVKLIEY